jgi:hypothetical protein
VKPPPPPPAIINISAPVIADGIVRVPLMRIHVYVAPLIVRVDIAPALDVIRAMGAESTYTPCPVVPRNDRVVVVVPEGEVTLV